MNWATKLPKTAAHPAPASTPKYVLDPYPTPDTTSIETYSTRVIALEQAMELQSTLAELALSEEGPTIDQLAALIGDIINLLQ